MKMKSQTLKDIMLLKLENAIRQCKNTVFAPKNKV